ncbi:response regulator [Acidaminobacter sp. JC074]|uniref:response regulator n=1 Tax=Acidaminobacter sp. JC074 TaxID=2530199 RepID=UPI001F0FE932|nr:response regulator [Acidaminobacter sp. JC074]MCH4888169.1 response regulator [Acidaminobacter sp. JC074]
MKAVIIDDERLAISRLKRMLEDFEEIEVIAEFSQSSEGMKYLYENDVDVVFLDINMPEFSGIGVASIINDENLPIQIIFTTGYTEYAVEAFDLEAVDYLIKPIAKKRLEKAIKRLEVTESKIKIKIQSFHSFQVWDQTNGSLVKWRTKKTKELFAYLIDKRNEVINREIIMDQLWREFDPKKAATNLNSTVYYLKTILKSLELDHLLITNKESIHFKFETDMIDYDLDRVRSILKSNALNKALFDVYKGPYMYSEDYEWASLKKNTIENDVSHFIRDHIDKIDNVDDKLTWLIKAIEVIPYDYEIRDLLVELLEITGKTELAEEYKLIF